jgi:hypothetical protein
MRTNILVGLLGVVLLCLLMLLGPAHAQTKAHTQTKSPPLPAGMTQQHYDELVKAAGQSVVETLNEKGLIAKSPAPTAKLKSAELDEEETAVDRVVSVLRKAPTALAGYPAVWANISQLPDRLDRTAAGGRVFGTFSACSRSWPLPGFLPNFLSGVSPPQPVTPLRSSLQRTVSFGE